MALREDEQRVLRWLSQYGPMGKTMLRKLLHYKPSTTAMKILQSLKRDRYITEIQNGDYFAIDRFCTPDPRMVSAVWIMIQFIEHIHPDEHRLADMPAQIFFLKDQVAYEIIVLERGEEHRLQLLQIQKNTKYIIVIPDMRMEEDLFLPDAPCLLATMEYETLIKDPKITFYSAGG